MALRSRLIYNNRLFYSRSDVIGVIEKKEEGRRKKEEGRKSFDSLRLGSGRVAQGKKKEEGRCNKIKGLCN
jgi:hypothetical protein